MINQSKASFKNITRIEDMWGLRLTDNHNGLSSSKQLWAGLRRIPKSRIISIKLSTAQTHSVNREKIDWLINGSFYLLLWNIFFMLPAGFRGKKLALNIITAKSLNEIFKELSFFWANGIPYFIISLYDPPNCDHQFVLYFIS